MTFFLLRTMDSSSGSRAICSAHLCRRRRTASARLIRHFDILPSNLLREGMSQYRDKPSESFNLRVPRPEQLVFFEIAVCSSWQKFPTMLPDEDCCSPTSSLAAVGRLECFCACRTKPDPCGWYQSRSS